MKKKRLLPLFTLLSFVFPLAGTEVDLLDDFINSTRESWNIPGVAISIVKDGDVVFEKGYGVTQIDRNNPIDENTIFQLASVTKTFTAAALGILVDQNKLSWDEPVVNRLPEFSLYDPYPTMYTTTRDLLAHRTGLGDFEGDLLGKLGYSNEEILKRIRYIKPTTSFRNKAHYSNVGYFVAGELLAQISGKTWEEAVKETLIDPLQMKRTGFAGNLDNKNVAKGHVFKEKTINMVDWDRTGGFPAAGAITSTASDMGIWMRMLLNGGEGILQSETIQEMFRSSMAGEISFSEAEPIDEQSGFDFGMGWGNYHYMGQMVVEKGGGLDGIRTVVTLVPGKKLGITVLTNLNLTLFPELIRAKFLELFVGSNGKDMQPAIKRKNEELAKILNPPEKPASPLPLSRPLQDFTGNFENTLYGLFTVRLDGNKLLLDAGPGKLQGALTHFGLDTFLLTWPVVNSGNDLVTFTFGPDGTVIGFQIEALGTFTAKKISDPTSLSRPSSTSAL